MLEILQSFDIWTGLSTLALTLLAIVGVRFAISLDLNRLLENRQERKRKKSVEKFRALCPHISNASRTNGETVLESSFQRVGQSSCYVCSICGLSVFSREEAWRELDYWADNLDEFRKRMKELDSPK